MFWQRVTYEFHEISITYMSQQNVEVTEGSPALKKQQSHNICRDLFLHDSSCQSEGLLMLDCSILYGVTPSR